MKKQRMTADNVEQLMEIVRALQTGEDPEEALERKKAESAPQADSPKSNPEEAVPETGTVRKPQRKPARKTVQTQEEPTEKHPPKQAEKKRTGKAQPKVEEDAFLDDEFEDNLEEDESRKLEKPDVNAVLDRISDGLWKFVQTVDLVIEPITSWQPKPKSGKKSRKAASPVRKERSPEKTDPEEDVFEEAETDDRDQESVLKEPDAVTEKPEAEKPEEAEAEEKPGAEAASVKPEEEAAKAGETEAEVPGAAETVAEAAETVTEESAKGKEREESELDELFEEDESDKVSGPRRGGIFKKLGEKGIHRKEIIMILLVLVLAAAIVILAVNGIRNAMDQKRKSENVVADKGLTVTVEMEPDEWCSAAQIQLRFRTPRVPVTKVTINGEILQPDARGYVTFTATEPVLAAEAETENGTLKATIEIPKLDSQAPEVLASRTQNQITLTGTDSRSSIRAVYYAVMKENNPVQIPCYQEYTGTIPFEEDVVYYFYAVDAAGNKSTPIVTNMENAEAISFTQDEIMMYPNQTLYLEPEIVPEGALLNNFRYESINPDIVSVDANGAVTALQEGSALIKVSADGVESATCMIQVSRTRTVTISTIGDCTLGSDISFNTTTNLDAFDAMNGHAYFFKNVKAILENDDATFANLECVLTTETSRASKTYAFKGDPSYTEILTEGSVEVVTLANNHSNDYGEQSYEDTVKYLKEAGIAYCDGDEIAIQDINGVRTAFIGIYVLRDGIAKEDQVRTTIAAAKEAGAELVIVAFHWGSEKSTQPDSTQQSLAHTAVDCGADLVVGHHPHVLQGIEKYNGKYIVYSLANFCFGGNTAPSDKDTMIFRQTFTFTDGTVQDDSNIEIIPCSVSSVADYNNYQPTPVTGTEIDRIMGRINEYSEQFGQSFSASNGLL